VTLRLTVQPDGRVGQAEVVKSSGRPALDLAAREWITAHWSYQPAIRNGGAAASQVLAVVNFTLTNP
jgi:TonB family protein